MTHAEQAAIDQYREAIAKNGGRPTVHQRHELADLLHFDLLAPHQHLDYPGQYISADAACFLRFEVSDLLTARLRAKGLDPRDYQPIGLALSNGWVPAGTIDDLAADDEGVAE